METVLKVKDLNINYKNRKKDLPVIINVNFEVLKGKCVALLGESGSGKSLTALSLFNALPKNFYINFGEIIKDEKTKMAYLFQDPFSALNPTFKLITQMKSVQRTSQKYNLEELLNLLQDLAFFEPEKKIKLYPHQLSGGMQQRFALALSLLTKPEILIADEPTTALDLTVQAKILSLFEKLLKEKLSILLITHDMGVVAQISNYVYLLYLGRILEGAPTNLFFKEPLHPYSKLLMASLEFKIKRERESNVPSFFEKPSGCPFHPLCQFKLEICEKEFPQIFEKEKQRVWCHLYK